jgi:hypothetical protein
MAPLNPYQSPRELDDARRSAIRPFYPKYRMERLLVFFSLFFGVASTFFDCLHVVLGDEGFNLGPVTYFEPPYWDEAAWTLAGTLSFVLLVAGVTQLGSTIKKGPPRTLTERWLTNVAVIVCFIPLLMGSYLGFERVDHAKAAILAFGSALIGAMFHFWYWFNHRQAALLVFWVLRSTDGRWIIRQLFYRRPGRP